MVPEAPLRETKFGLVADVDGWFVVNAQDARWREWEPFGVYCDFEGKRPFRQLGLNISVFQPGQSFGFYHREHAQEGFLVLAGECLLIVEGEERRLRKWDFLHSNPGSVLMIVGAGAGPCVVVAVGARGLPRKGLVYVVSETARRHGVSVDKETTKPQEAYTGLSRSKRVVYGGWLAGQP